MFTVLDFTKRGLLLQFLKDHKVVCLQNVPYKGNDLFRFYNDLLMDLGEPVPMDEDLSTEQKTGNNWIEIRYDPAFPLSYRHSDTRQPLHTDGSYERNAPDINLFFCYAQALVGGATTFIDSRLLVDILKVYNKGLLDTLKSVPVTFAKGADSKTQPIIVEDGNDYRMTWNYFRVSKDEGFCSSFHNFLERKVVEGGLLTPVMLHEGEAVFFNDEKLLHGRNAFIGPRYLLKGGVKLRDT